MRLQNFLFIVFFVICFNAEGQNKKVLENQINDLFQSYERIATKIGMLEEKLRASEEKVTSLNTQVYNLTTQVNNLRANQNNDNSKKGLVENSSQLEQKEEPQKQKKQEFGQCKATTKKGSRCSRSAGSSGYCYQHLK
jgi:peptidoglycan hydrolase CwlO-like protein